MSRTQNFNFTITYTKRINLKNLFEHKIKIMYIAKIKDILNTTLKYINTNIVCLFKN